MLQFGLMLVLPIFTKTWLLDCKWRRVRRFKRTLQGFEKGFYWNDNIRFILEMYFEVFLISMIRCFTREQDTKYEIAVTILAAVIAVGMVLFFLAVLNIALTYKSQTHNEEVEEKYGSIFEDLAHKRSFTYIYNPLFCYGRIYFVLVLIFMQKKPWAQVMLITWYSLFMTMFVSHVKPFENPAMNSTEFINQWAGLAVITFCFCFTDFVPDGETRFMIGWVILGLCACFLLINIVI
jgi:uncharacterized membrane protein